jgi:hypothetical protein
MSAFNQLGQVSDANPWPTRDGMNPFAVSVGINSDLKSVSINGIRTNISAVADAVVERLSSVLAPMAGIAMSIVSTSAADTGISIMVSAIGPNGILKAPFLVTLNGTTPVALGSLSRINRLARISGDIAGTVTVFNGANVYGGMIPGAQISRSASYCVPVGYKLGIGTFISSILKNANNSQNAFVSVILKSKPMASTGFGGLLDVTLSTLGTSGLSLQQELSTSVTGPADIQITAKGSEANLDVQVYLSAWLANVAVYP